MNQCRQTSTWLFLTLASVLGAGEVAAAEEKTTPPPAPVEDSLAIAKREFEAAKLGRDPALQQKGELPRLSVPTMSAPTAPSGGWTAPKAATPEKKSENWLVEAMEKPTDARGERGRLRLDRERPDRLTSERERLTDAPANAQSDESNAERRASPEPAGESSGRKPTAATNPLARFLGTWMTAQDYALLKPGIEQAFAPGPNASAGSRDAFSANSVSAFALPMVPGVDGMIGGGVPARSPTPASAPRENPFLATLSFTPSGTSTPPVPMPTVALPGAVSASPAIAPVPQPPPAKSPIPDFAKPAADEKYFKQLKRF